MEGKKCYHGCQRQCFCNDVDEPSDGTIPLSVRKSFIMIEQVPVAILYVHGTLNERFIGSVLQKYDQFIGVLHNFRVEETHDHFEVESPYCSMTDLDLDHGPPPGRNSFPETAHEQFQSLIAAQVISILVTLRPEQVQKACPVIATRIS